MYLQKVQKQANVRMYVTWISNASTHKWCYEPVHKVRQHFFGGGVEIDEIVMTDNRQQKVMTWERGVSKIETKILTYFMDDPYQGVEKVSYL